jgi:hypothetical protein
VRPALVGTPKFNMVGWLCRWNYYSEEIQWDIGNDFNNELSLFYDTNYVVMCVVSVSKVCHTIASHNK